MWKPCQGPERRTSPGRGNDYQSLTDLAIGRSFQEREECDDTGLIFVVIYVSGSTHVFHSGFVASWHRPEKTWSDLGEVSSHCSLRPQHSITELVD